MADDHKTRDAYVAKLKAQLDEWDADIAKLHAKMAKAKAEQRLAYEKKVKQLKQEQQAAQAMLNELQNASGQAWHDLKAGIESAWDRLGTAVRQATSRFQ